MTEPSSVEAQIALLTDRKSTVRCRAAKQLRKLQDPGAGPALLGALQREVQDPRTWETQYQMIMALAECNYRPALPFLQQLAARRAGDEMVDIGLGDALVRMGRTSEHDAGPLLAALNSGKWGLIDGALRAVAMLHLQPPEAVVERVLDYATKLDPTICTGEWVAAAAAGWSGPAVDRFLDACLLSPQESLREAATAAKQKKYVQWKPS